MGKKKDAYASQNIFFEFAQPLQRPELQLYLARILGQNRNFLIRQTRRAARLGEILLCCRKAQRRKDHAPPVVTARLPDAYAQRPVYAGGKTEGFIFACRKQFPAQTYACRFFAAKRCKLLVRRAFQLRQPRLKRCLRVLRIPEQSICRFQHRIAHQKLHALVLPRIRICNDMEPDQLLRQTLLLRLQARAKTRQHRRQQTAYSCYVSFFHKNTA